MRVGETGRPSRLSATEISPVHGVRRLRARRRIMSSDTFPDVYSTTLWVPYTALGEQGPGNIQFPNSGGIADDCSGHCGREGGGGGSTRSRSGEYKGV